MTLEYSTLAQFIYKLKYMNFGTIDHANYIKQMNRRIELLPFYAIGVITEVNTTNSILNTRLNTSVLSGTNGWLSRHCLCLFQVDKQRRIFLESESDSVQIILTFN